MEHGLRVQLCCDDADAWRPRVESGLRQHGLRLAGDDEPGHRPATLVLFDALSPAVLEAVAGASRGGRDRALAVATNRQVLGDDGAWALLRHGASDAFAWDEIDDPLAQVAARLERWSRIDGLIAAPAVRAQLVGASAAWVACLRQAVELAAFSDGPVLLLGESGTGKELLARLVHSLDQRPDKGDLIVLDCTTVVPELSGSEFFGHERGAFTGAAGPRDGAFALADGGTLFLDEVGELPLSLQAQLLRVVQERTYKRVGSNVWQRTNFRLVCATHRDLRQDVAAGRFRSDFYHRIASRICHLPALRDRREDILPLAQQFLRAARDGRPGPGFDRAVARFLIERDYPGNVRELRQLVERIGDRHVGPGPITPGDIPEDERLAPAAMAETDTPGIELPPAGARGVAATLEEAIVQALESGSGLREISRQATDTAIRLALASENGNLQRAAKRLGVTDRALQMRRAQRAD
jgi:transcriptional regulator with GAF, ATPase, and Fis domain